MNAVSWWLDMGASQSSNRCLNWKILHNIATAEYFRPSGMVVQIQRRYNYLNDLPSLDPELYCHLIILKVTLMLLSFFKIYLSINLSLWLGISIGGVY
ncbi:hypothetical protein EZV62_025004 [Acer yangbiense]|uniref:Uncharacterized protein n=1 Tax=Acer yangbiense TaxID=1000413 RepID=A0A5C7GX81_9ROSI|nr:hypothetical protein EZV62_025004 [Acer yangbiense]